MAVDRMTGRIVKVYPDRGFGWIKGDDGIDYFFHRSGLETMGLTFEQLNPPAKVDFTIIEAPKGPRAIEVHIRSQNLHDLPLDP